MEPGPKELELGYRSRTPTVQWDLGTRKSSQGFELGLHPSDFTKFCPILSHVHRCHKLTVLSIGILVKTSASLGVKVLSKTLFFQT